MSYKSRIILSTVALSLAVAVAGPVHAKGKGKGKEAPFDFAKTSAFMHEMDRRPDFPVGTVLANDYVYTVLALGEKIDTGRANAVVAAIKLSQQKNGGVSSDRRTANASILYTDIALETLELLNAPDALDRGKLKSFVSSLKNPDGGFGFSSDAKKSSLATTYYAVHVLKRINGLDLVDKGKTAQYVKSFGKSSGGFGQLPGKGVANARNTYMAAYVLNALGVMDDSTLKSSLTFLEGTPYLDKKSKERRDLDEQLFAMRALRELKAAGRVDRENAVAFMKRLYIKVNGGFGPLEGYGSTPDSTATALRVLVEAGKVKGPAVLVAKR